ncbi:DNA methyltransferase [Priestia aryabhattai]|uniref:type I restriction-modification system subunit M n=1 Tax=Priestia aryabhattai TaxID=412384 RepID=UPI000B4FDFE4|nr:class I SAM-dependent DNA methyltransferase [Priestia aryabhattai]OVE34162.1 DNA methyltransferase [Priestia aryabhattai]
MTRDSLENLIKNCTDILRTDDGISGSIHYTEALSWLLFLKFLDDQEKEAALEAEMEFEDYNYILDEKYRWQNWARKSHLTGSELINFVNNDLIPYLAALNDEKGVNTREVISSIFSEVTNRVRSGYLLKDILLKIDEIHFNSSDDIHTLSVLYESLLQKMGDDGGNSGEFYTPRPVVRFIVETIAPEIGQTIFDPAAGSCGFLVESNEYLKTKANTAEKVRILSEKTFFGKEKTPLAYLLGLMNMLLHGVEYPQIEKTNTLNTNIREIDESDKFDIIMANPPFGGKEQKIIQQNFPFQTQSTEVLFLQYIMKSLKFDGKAGVVVPEGVLFQSNSTYKAVKQELLEKYNLHSVVSLPAGVFLPYSGVKTSILYFEKKGKTKDVWFYDVPLIDGKNLTKNKGITFGHFEHAYKIFKEREETEHSWLVPVEQILENDTNLTAAKYNPHLEDQEDLLEPHVYSSEIQNVLEEALSLISSLNKTI